MRILCILGSGLGDETIMPPVDALTNVQQPEGPFATMVGYGSDVVLPVLAENLPNDLHWRTILLTVCIATLIWLLRRGHGAKGADGRERRPGAARFLLH